MQTVAIVGVGLIGASFGLAIRKAGFNGEILGVSSPAAVQAGLSVGAISSACSLEDAAAGADLIYLAQPVDGILETLVRLGPMARQGTLITDAGSTKAEVVRVAGLHVREACFIGGHPMAGKEIRGAQAADADLFRDRPYVLTPVDHEPPTHFVDLLRQIGANVNEMSPAEHDRTVSLTSHLPQLISTALAAMLAEQSNAHIKTVHGAGLLDMTRLSMSPADLWSSILATNKENVLAALKAYSRMLSAVEIGLENESLSELFRKASGFSSKLRKPGN